MREIKFRAWDKQNKRLVTVSLIDLKYEGILFEVENGSNSRKFDEVELMQFTGLKDKKGVEIYEGDIFQKGELKGIIEWKQYGWGYTLIKPMFHMQFTMEDVEIIGNIYENHEL